MIADRALADDELGRDAGRTLAVGKAGQHRPLAAGEQAEPRVAGEGGQLMEPGEQPGRVQLVRYPQHVRLQPRLAGGVDPGAGAAPPRIRANAIRGGTSGEMTAKTAETSHHCGSLALSRTASETDRSPLWGVFDAREKARRVRGVDRPQNRDADALLGGDPEESGDVLADAIDPPGAVDRTENHVAKLTHRRRRQRGELAVGACCRRHGDEPDPRAAHLDRVHPHGERLTRVPGTVAGADRLVTGQVTIGQGPETQFG